jgi:DNA-binding NarL/FixJ family response regulator
MASALSLTICVPNTLTPVLPFPDRPVYTVRVGHSTKRILIADDHESVLRALRVMLEAHPGWEVCGEAANGYEALTKAIELRPDLIILDFAMPKVDGLKAANEISKLLPGVQIVLHTMYGARVVLEAHKRGIFRVVEKANSGALVSAVEELLNANVEPTDGPEFRARSGGDTTNQHQG